MSSLYTPYKAVGYVTDENPFCINRLGEEIFITTAIGRSFQVYRFDKLTACMVSHPVDEPIRCIQVRNHETYAAIGARIVVFHRNRAVNTYEAHARPILGMCIVGRYLFSYDDTNMLVIHDVKSRVKIDSMTFLTSAATTHTNLHTHSSASQSPPRIACIAHPSTYLNKFLVGFTGGALELWNFRTKQMIYSYKSTMEFMHQQAAGKKVDGLAQKMTLKLSHSKSKNEKNEKNTEFFGTKDSDKDTTTLELTPSPMDITCIEQSPACDVAAIGYHSGHILLLHLKLDQILFFFEQDGGSVTSLSFRTDALAEKYPFLVSSSGDGRLHVWNLGTGPAKSDDSDEEEGGNGAAGVRRLQCSIDDAHRGSVSKVSFLYGEPIMVSAGTRDNSLKVWIFDAPDGSARLLRYREGHSGVPLKIRYYGGSVNASLRENTDAGASCELISAGSDRTLRLFNTALENQNRELSQNPILRSKSAKFGGGKTKEKVILGKLSSRSGGKRHERLPICTNYDFCETRQRDWGNLVTIHANHTNVYVWKFKHRVITDLILTQPKWIHKSMTNRMRSPVDLAMHATAVCLTACGSFCLVGYRGGVVYRYNMQSGISRGSYPAAAQKTSAAQWLYDEFGRPVGANGFASATTTTTEITGKLGGKDTNTASRWYKKRAAMPGNVFNEEIKLAEEAAEGARSLNPTKSEENSEEMGAFGRDRVGILGHEDEVTGLFVDAMNETAVSCGMDGRVIFWDFLRHNVTAALEMGSAQLLLHGFRDANFVAIAGQNKQICVFDIQTQRISRRFCDGHTREITDLAFSPDGRRLLSAAYDRTLRVWDMPTGRCINWLQFESAILSLTISHSGEYLCVSQSGKEGIYMYVDRSLYETVHVWQEPKKPTAMQDSLVRVDHLSAASKLDAAAAAGDSGESESENSNSDDDEEEEEESDSAQQDPLDGKERAGAGEVAEAVMMELGMREGSTHRDLGQRRRLSEEAEPQRSQGSITASAVPRAYWATLFNLELIKERNRAQAAPVAPPKAPFFLPTIVRDGGATPSFPTPAEFDALRESHQRTTTAAAATETTTIEEESVGGKKRAREQQQLQQRQQQQQQLQVKKRVEDGNVVDASEIEIEGEIEGEKEGEKEGEEEVLKELAGMSAVWDDAADNSNNNKSNDNDNNEGEKEGEMDFEWSLDTVGQTRAAADGFPEKSADSEQWLAQTATKAVDFFGGSGAAFSQQQLQSSASKSASRLLKSRKRALPRCKLMAYLLQEFQGSVLDALLPPESAFQRHKLQKMDKNSQNPRNSLLNDSEGREEDEEEEEEVENIELLTAFFSLCYQEIARTHGIPSPSFSSSPSTSFFTPSFSSALATLQNSTLPAWLSASHKNDPKNCSISTKQTPFSTEIGGFGAANEDGPLLTYLKSLPPPAVDLEIRALCTHKEDILGVALVRALLLWIAGKIVTGANFELLQAYMHRVLSVHSPLFLDLAVSSSSSSYINDQKGGKTLGSHRDLAQDLGSELRYLQSIQGVGNARFRDMVQKNLCLLKMMANIPIT